MQSTVDKLIKDYLGKQVEYHSFNPNAKFQCVDLANIYIDRLGLNVVIGTDAKNFPSKINTKQFEVIKNTPEFVPIVGDIPIWNGRVGGGAGHIAVVRDNKATTNTFNSVDQNWSKPLHVTLETHNYSNVSHFLRPKEKHMSDKIELEEKVFEELVTKSSRWDGVLAAGYTSVAQIEQEVKQLKQAASDAKASQKTEYERAEGLRRQFNHLIAVTAKALNTQQEVGQIEAALLRVDKELDELEVLRGQYAALQIESGKKEEELRAEIKRLESLITSSGSLAGSAMEDLLRELVRRFTNILKGRSV